MVAHAGSEHAKKGADFSQAERKMVTLSKTLRRITVNHPQETLGSQVIVQWPFDGGAKKKTSLTLSWLLH